MKNSRLSVFCLCFAIGTGISLAFGERLLIYIACLFICSIVYGFVSKRIAAVIAAIGIVCGFFYTSAYVKVIEQPARNLDGELQRVHAVAVDYPIIYDDQQRVRVKIYPDSISTPTKINTLMYLSITEKPIEIGDDISAFVEFSTADMSEGFDRNTYYRSLGVSVLASQVPKTDLEIIAPKHRPISYYPKLLGRKFRSVLYELFDERNASFLSALLLGNRYDLNTIDYNHLVKSGLCHVTAVSGLHVGFLIALLILLLGRKWASIFGIPILCGYVLMVGASPSVLRAAIMYSLVLIAFLFRREENSIDFLMYALFIVLVPNPSAIMSVGLQLSFTATLCIILFSKRIVNAMKLKKKNVPRTGKKLWDGISSIIACSVCAMMICPILLYHFGYMSVWSAVSNLLALWVVSAVFVLGFITCAVGLIYMKAAAVLAYPLGILVRYIWFVADSFSSIKGGLLTSESILSIVTVSLIIVAYIAIFLSKKRRLILLSVAVLIVCMISYSIWDGQRVRNKLRITCIPNGSAQAVVITKGEKAILVDCGTSGYRNPTDSIEEYLDWWNYNGIDTLVLTAYNQSHAGALEDILQRFEVSDVWTADGQSTDVQQYISVIKKYLDNIHTVSETDFTDISQDIPLSLSELDEHLAVKVQTDTKPLWIVHSLTQNRLITLLNGEKQDCSTLICSEYLFDDDNKKNEILSLLNPSEIILENGWSDYADAGNIPVYIVKKQGSITKCYP